MKPSDELFQLIRSMSKAERGYFIKYSKVHVKGEQNNYLRLFEVLADMNEYSEEYLKRKLRHDSVLSYLSTAKNQLHGIILKTMRPYYEEYSTNARLGDMNNDVEFLHSKVLKVQSVRLNNRLKQGSITNEKPLLLIEALNRDYKLLLEEMDDAGKRDEVLEKTWSEQKKAMKILGNTLEMEYVKQKVLSFAFRNGYVRDEKDYLILKEIVNDKLTGELKNCLSSDAEINLYLIRSQYFMLTGKFEKAYRILGKLLGIFEGQVLHIKNHPGRYFSILEDLTLAYIKCGKFKDATNINGKIKRLPDYHTPYRTDYFRNKILLSTFSNELMIHLSSGEYSKGTALLDDEPAELEFALHKADQLSRMNLFLRVSVLYFLTGEYRKALQKLQEILCDSSEKQNKDLECFVKIYYLLIQLELDNKEHLFYAIKSASRAMVRKSCMYPFETVMLAFFRSMINKGRKEGSKEEALRQLCHELRIIKEDEYGARSFEHFDFLDWANRKYTAMLIPHDNERSKQEKNSKKIPVDTGFTYRHISVHLK